MTLFILKNFQQIIEILKPARRGFDLIRSHAEEPFIPGQIELFTDYIDGEPGMTRKRGKVESMRQSQCVHHKLKNDITFFKPSFLYHGRAAPGLDHVALRYTVTGTAPDLERGNIGELAVGAGPDSEVIAEFPVIKIVPAAMTGPGVGGDLVLPVTMPVQQFLPLLLDFPQQMVIRKYRRCLVK